MDDGFVMPGKAVAEAVQGGRISFFPISKRKKMSELETSKGNKEMRQKCVGMMTMPAMALILLGCVIWVHRAYLHKD